MGQIRAVLHDKIITASFIDYQFWRVIHQMKAQKKRDFLIPTWYTVLFKKNGTPKFWSISINFIQNRMKSVLCWLQSINRGIFSLKASDWRNLNFVSNGNWGSAARPHCLRGVRTPGPSLGTTLVSSLRSPDCDLTMSHPCLAVKCKSAYGTDKSCVTR